MKRRDFFEDGLAVGAAVAAAVSFPGAAQSAKAKPAREKMYVRTQNFGNSDKELMFLQRCGVKHKCGRFRFIPGRGWDKDDIKQIIDQNAKFGINLDMTSLPISIMFPNIIGYGKSPERDREIDMVCDMIRNAAGAGVDSLRYDVEIPTESFSTREFGRGGYDHKAVRMDKVPKEAQEKLTKYGRVNSEMYWERITYLLDRMIPVANEYKVRMGCAQGTWVPAGHQGIDKVLITFDGMKRFIDIQRSPCHGLNMCLGSIAHNIKDPVTGIYPFIKYFGEKKTLFLIHYRNIIGAQSSWREALPDEGDLDLVRAIKALKDAGYHYGLDPDHTPTCPDDRDRRQAHAYAFGYINAMIQAVYSD